jgi:hypothetical protein
MRLLSSMVKVPLSEQGAVLLLPHTKHAILICGPNRSVMGDRIGIRRWLSHSGPLR